MGKNVCIIYCVLTVLYLIITKGIVLGNVQFMVTPTIGTKCRVMKIFLFEIALIML